MLNISLCFNRKDFEYDVYSLIKAFYPGCEITSWYEAVSYTHLTLPTIA